MRVLACLLFSPLLMSSMATSGCLKKSCDPSINFAFGKQRASIAARMGDLVGALREMRVANRENNYLSAKELIELARIQQRYRIRTYQIMEQKHHYQQLKSEAYLGGFIQNIIADKAEEQSWQKARRRVIDEK